MMIGKGKMAVAAESGPLSVDSVDAHLIERLVSSYFIQVDRPDSEKASNLFTEQAELILGSVHLKGREAIAQFLRQRETDNTHALRLVRHVPGPMGLSRSGPRNIKGYSTVLVFAGIGKAPLPSASPSTICDFEDSFVQVGDEWLFERRQATVLFVGAAAATFAK